MKTLRNSLLIGLTAFGLTTSVLADNHHAAGHASASASATAASAEQCHPGMMGKLGHFADGKFAEHMQARMEKKLTKLHDLLKLLPNQEPAWTTFITSLKPPARPDATARAALHAQLQKLSAPERGDYMLTQLKLRETMFAEKLAVLKTFYATLTAEQQKVFNDNFHPLRHGPGLGAHAGHGNLANHGN